MNDKDSGEKFCNKPEIILASEYSIKKIELLGYSVICTYNEYCPNQWNEIMNEKISRFQLGETAVTQIISFRPGKRTNEITCFLVIQQQTDSNR